MRKIELKIIKQLQNFDKINKILLKKDGEQISNILESYYGSKLLYKSLKK